MVPHRARRFFLILVLFAAVAMVPAAGADWMGKTVPTMTAKNDAGAAVSLDTYKGKVILLNVWASWCGPCLKELPQFDAMAGRFAGSDAVLVAVSVDTASAPAKRMKAKLGIKNLTMLYDEAQGVPDAMKVDTMPSTFIIDRKGVVRMVQQGFSEDAVAKMETLMRDLLKEGAPSGSKASN